MSRIIEYDEDEHNKSKQPAAVSKQGSKHASKQARPSSPGRGLIEKQKRERNQKQRQLAGFVVLIFCITSNKGMQSYSTGASLLIRDSRRARDALIVDRAVPVGTTELVNELTCSGAGRPALELAVIRGRRKLIYQIENVVVRGQSRHIYRRQAKGTVPDEVEVHVFARAEVAPVLPGQDAGGARGVGAGREGVAKPVRAAARVRICMVVT